MKVSARQGRTIPAIGKEADSSMPQNVRHLPAASNSLMARFAAWPKLYGLLLLAWMFDFQSEEAGKGFAIQSIYLVAYLFALVLFLVSEKDRGIKARGLFLFVVLGTLYIADGLIAGLFNRQPIYSILRNGLAVMIYVTMAFATVRVMLTHNASMLRAMLGGFCLVYAVMFFIFTNANPKGIDYSTIRFQIVGTSSIPALGYLTLAFMFRLTRVEILTTAVNAVLVLISVTRTYLLVAAGQMIVLFTEFRRAFSPRMVAVAASLSFAGLAILTLGSDQVVRWQDRLNGRGSSQTEYQTLFTRQSEWQFMYDSWTHSPFNFLFGSGFAARTVYFTTPEAGGKAEFMIGFGHNQYLSMLFTGGASGGLPLILLQIFQGFLAFRFLRQALRNPRLRNDAVFLGCWGATIILGNLVANVFSASFVLRGISLWYGIGTGLLLGAQALFDPENYQPSRAKPRPRLRPRLQ